MSKASTRASKRYQEKVGIVPRTYKLKSQIADEFKDACQARGESQASVITRLMNEYINKPSHTETKKEKAPSDIKKANEARRNKVRELLLEHPEKSNQDIVRMGGGAFAKDTVRRVRDSLIKSGELNPKI